jgi:small subunit ribosomal protein S1
MERYPLEPGDRVIGYVTHLSPFGAFIEFEESDWHGIVLLLEISWHHIHHPSDVLTLGQEIEAEVIRIIPERRHLALSIRRCQENPWEEAVPHYEVGQIVETVISRVSSFGASACLIDHPLVEGILPSSERDVQKLEIGQAILLQITTFDPERQRLRFRFPRE